MIDAQPRIRQVHVQGKKNRVVHIQWQRQRIVLSEQYGKNVSGGYTPEAETMVKGGCVCVSDMRLIVVGDNGLLGGVSGG